MFSLRVWLAFGLAAGVGFFGYTAYKMVKNHGYDIAQVEFAKAQKAQEEIFAKELQAKQDEILEVEQELLNDDIKTRVEYRDRKVAVEKEVVRYVKANNLSDCKLGDDGVRLVNQALSEATASRSPE